jgi:release factor glutamine methyltransferase
MNTRGVGRADDDVTPRDIAPGNIAPGDVVARLREAGCVFAEDEAALLRAESASEDDLEARLRRRVGGEPLEHVLGWAAFRGRRVTVEPGVFVPRPRTELLVTHALALLPGAGDGDQDGVEHEPEGDAGTAPGDVSGPVVVDLCCGSGAVGAAVLAVRPDVVLHAADVDPTAVGCARRNLAGTGAHVHEGDLDGPLPGSLRGRVRVLVANVPYVPSDDLAFMPPEARLHEPRGTLDGGTDGLDVLRRVAALAPGWLAPGGFLLVETSERQAPVASEVFTRHGLAADVVRAEELEATVVVGRRQG